MPNSPTETQSWKDSRKPQKARPENAGGKRQGGSKVPTRLPVGSSVSGRVASFAGVEAFISPSLQFTDCNRILPLIKRLLQDLRDFFFPALPPFQTRASLAAPNANSRQRRFNRYNRHCRETGRSFPILTEKTDGGLAKAHYASIVRHCAILLARTMVIPRTEAGPCSIFRCPTITIPIRPERLRRC